MGIKNLTEGNIDLNAKIIPLHHAIKHMSLLYKQSLNDSFEMIGEVIWKF